MKGWGPFIDRRYWERLGQKKLKCANCEIDAQPCNVERRDDNDDDDEDEEEDEEEDKNEDEDEDEDDDDDPFFFLSLRNLF